MPQSPAPDRNAHEPSPYLDLDVDLHSGDGLPWHARRARPAFSYRTNFIFKTLARPNFSSNECVSSNGWIGRSAGRCQIWRQRRINFNIELAKGRVRPAGGQGTTRSTFNLLAFHFQNVKRTISILADISMCSSPTMNLIAPLGVGFGAGVDAPASVDSRRGPFSCSFRTCRVRMT